MLEKLGEFGSESVEQGNKGRFGYRYGKEERARQVRKDLVKEGAKGERERRFTLFHLPTDKGKHKLALPSSK
jgi:hypothetical protein